MKFKVLAGTELFNNLLVIKEEIDSVRAASKKIWEKIEGCEGISENNHHLAGGIRAFSFKQYMSKKDCLDGWRLLEKGYSHWAFPKSSDKSNKQLLADIAALPVVESDRLKELLKYGNYGYCSGGGLGFSSVPGIGWFDGYILIQCPESIEYTPVEGMIEITVSEFNKLNKEK